MKRILMLEKVMLAGHIISMVFGLAGLVLVMPHPGFIVQLPAIGQRAFQLSLANGGVAYMIMATLAVSAYACRTLGTYRWLSFMLPAITLSLSSELLGTSTGFPFGEYRYLSGLGYKIAGLVPFTIPLSWFYLGFSVYVLAGAGLAGLARRRHSPTALTGSWLAVAGTIALGAVMLTAWDFVLDPAMSQAPTKFWEFLEAGSFFGMPYRNITGWLATGAIYMGVASLFWGKQPVRLERSQLTLPLWIYLVNVAFGAVITLAQLDQQFLLPTLMALVCGVLPALGLWWAAGPLPVDAETTDAAAVDSAAEASSTDTPVVLKSSTRKQTA